MRRSLEIAGDSSRTIVVRTGQFILALRARRELWIVTLVATMIVVALLVTGVICIWRPSGATTATAGAVDAEQAWRYLVVCQQCGHRERTLEHPARTLDKQNGLLRCPACGRFTAAWFRRGSQSLPPGGWSTTQAVPDAPADAEEGYTTP